MIRVLIADDQGLLRGGLKAILDAEDDIEVVAEACDGAEAVDEALRTHPDVVLMDIRMPRLDGLEATKRLLASGSRARILVITTFDHDEYVYRALRAGAAGFLLKSASAERLTDAVRTVASGESLLDPQITTRLVEHFLARPDFDAGTRARLDPLTAREREVLTLLARGMSNADMGRELFLSETTIKSHVTRMLSKLGVNSRVQAVVVAYETGLVRPGANLRRREVAAAQEGVLERIEVILLPRRRLDVEVVERRAAEGQRLAEGVVGEAAHELAEVDVGDARVAADDEHVLVVGVRAGLAEVGRAGDDGGSPPSGSTSMNFVCTQSTLVPIRRCAHASSCPARWRSCSCRPRPARCAAGAASR